MANEIEPSNASVEARTDIADAWLRSQEWADFQRLATPSITDLEDEVQRRKNPFYETAIEPKGIVGHGLMVKGGVYSVLEDSPELRKAQEMINEAGAVRRQTVRGMSDDRLDEKIREARRVAEAAREQREEALRSQTAVGRIPTYVVTSDLPIDMLGKPMATGRVYPSGHPVGVHDTGNYDPGAEVLKIRDKKYINESILPKDKSLDFRQIHHELPKLDSSRPQPYLNSNIDDALREYLKG